MFGSVGEFLRDNNPQAYSFELECEYEDIQAISVLERYLAYKATKQVGPYHKATRLCVDYNEKYPRWTECDSSDLAREVYTKLWGWSGKKRTYGKVCLGDSDNMLFGGDTINSAQTIFNEILKRVAEKRAEEYSKHMKGTNISLLYALELYCDLEDDLFKNLLDEEKSLEQYIDLYHTLGNFVLIPQRYNTWRHSKFKDFWDFSLQYLKCPDNNNNNYLPSEKFTEYINCFFLWDYVYRIDKHNYGVRSMQSKEFQRSCYKGPCPERKVDMANIKISLFLENAIWAIKRRGIFMTAMLRLESAMGPEKYGELRNQVFATDHTYSGYDKVINEIEDELKQVPVEKKEIEIIEKALDELAKLKE